MGTMCWSWTLLLFLSFTFLLTNKLSEAKHLHPANKLPSSAAVVGTVYCDTCFHQDYPNSNHFIAGATVAVECKKSKSSTPYFRQEAKTDSRGEFRVELPFSVSKHVRNLRACSVALIRSNEPFCAAAAAATSSSLRLKSRSQGKQIFSAGYFTFRPQVCDQSTNTFKNGGSTGANRKISTRMAFFFLPPVPLLPPPSLVPPVLPTPPAGLIPPVLPTPPPSLVPPVLPTPPSSTPPSLPLVPPVPGVIPSPPSTPPPALPVPLPPLPSLPTPPSLPVPLLPTPPAPSLPTPPSLPVPFPPVPLLPTPPSLPVPLLPTPPSLPAPSLPTPPSLPVPLPPVPLLPPPLVPGGPPAKVSSETRTSQP